MRDYQISATYKFNVLKQPKERQLEKVYSKSQSAKSPITQLTADNIAECLDRTASTLYDSTNPNITEEFLACVKFLECNHFVGINLQKALHIALFKVDVNDRLVNLCADYLVHNKFQEISSVTCLELIVKKGVLLNDRYDKIIKACTDDIIQNGFSGFDVGSYLGYSMTAPSYNSEVIFNLCLQYIESQNATYCAVLQLVKSIPYYYSHVGMLTKFLDTVLHKYHSILLDPDLNNVPQVQEFLSQRNVQWHNDTTIEMVNNFSIFASTLNSAAIKFMKYIEMPNESIHEGTRNMSAFCKFASLIHFTQSNDEKLPNNQKIFTPALKKVMHEIALGIFQNDKKLYENLCDPLMGIWEIFDQFLTQEERANAKLAYDLLFSKVSSHTDIKNSSHDGKDKDKDDDCASSLIGDMK